MGRKRLYQTDEALAVIVRETARNGRPPTIEELRVAMGLGSTRTVVRYLNELENLGDITRRSGTRNVLVVKPMPRPSAAVWRDLSPPAFTAEHPHGTHAAWWVTHEDHDYGPYFTRANAEHVLRMLEEEARPERRT